MRFKLKTLNTTIVKHNCHAYICNGRTSSGVSMIELKVLQKIIELLTRHHYRSVCKNVNVFCYLEHTEEE